MSKNIREKMDLSNIFITASAVAALAITAGFAVHTYVEVSQHTFNTEAVVCSVEDAQVYRKPARTQKVGKSTIMLPADTDYVVTVKHGDYTKRFYDEDLYNKVVDGDLDSIELNWIEEISKDGKVVATNLVNKGETIYGTPAE